MKLKDFLELTEEPMEIAIYSKQQPERPSRVLQTYDGKNTYQMESIRVSYNHLYTIYGDYEVFSVYIATHESLTVLNIGVYEPKKGD